METVFSPARNAVCLLPGFALLVDIFFGSYWMPAFQEIIVKTVALTLVPSHKFTLKINPLCMIFLSSRPGPAFLRVWFEYLLHGGPSG